MKDLGIVGTIGRFKPVHNGHSVLLEHLCLSAEYVKIGIGSSNKYNVRNPFHPEETKEMIDLVLKKNFENYDIKLIPDFGHIAKYSDGQKWKKNVKKEFGNLDYFLTGNSYVGDILKDDYEIQHPLAVIPQNLWNDTTGRSVRLAMAKGEKYNHLIPKIVKEYLEENKLIDRFRKKFGQETIDYYAKDDFTTFENIDNEKKNIANDVVAYNGVKIGSNN